MIKLGIWLFVDLVMGGFGYLGCLSLKFLPVHERFLNTPQAPCQLRVHKCQTLAQQIPKSPNPQIPE